MLHRQQNRDIVVVDLFAGAGGLSLGLEAAGFKVAVAVEKDQDLRRYAICSGIGSDTPNLKKQTT